MLLNT